MLSIPDTHAAPYFVDDDSNVRSRRVSVNVSTLSGTGPLLDLPHAARSLSNAVNRPSNEVESAFQAVLVPEQPEADLRIIDAAVEPAQADVPAQILPSTPMDADTSDAATVFSHLKLYAPSESNRSTQAYQEYAKAWGGRVVHGEVELPPLSIYVD